MRFPQNLQLIKQKCLIYAVVLAFVTLAPAVALGQGSTLERDAYTLSTSAGTNFGSATIVRVSGSGSGAIGNGYFRFKMTTSLPPNPPFTPDKIAKATVKLYVSAVTAGGAVDVYTVGATWAENSITYTSAPPTGTLILSNVTVPSQGSYLVIDLTDTAKAWWGNDTTNFGIVLKANAGSPNLNVQFDTKENLSTSHDAKNGGNNARIRHGG